MGSARPRNMPYRMMPHSTYCEIAVIEWSVHDARRIAEIAHFGFWRCRLGLARELDCLLERHAVTSGPSEYEGW